MLNTNTTPAVSICCMTYNHVNFIEYAIKSFLRQKTNFPFEIIIYDDASTDGTSEIVEQYVKKHPQLIHAIIQTENQYSKGEHIFYKYILPETRGKFIAICEGDDYWTDSNKLQKQVHFLSNNPEYSICVGGYRELYNNTFGKTVITNNQKNKDPNYNGYTFTLEDMRRGWITKTLTAVLRRDVMSEIDFSVYKHTRDIHLFYHVVKNHKGFYFNEVFGVYRKHEGGVHSMKEGIVRSMAAYNCYKELYEQNGDEYTRKMAYFHTLALLNFCLYNKCNRIRALRKFMLFIEALKLVRKIKEVKHLFYVFISPRLKKNLTA